MSGANDGFVRNTDRADGIGAWIPVRPAHYRPRDRTDWDAVGGSHHDRDKAGNCGGGRDGTSRPRFTET